MPLVDIQLIEGVFDKSQKQEMIRKVTDAMVAVEGEAMRGVTWVRVQEVASGEWAIGGKALDRRRRQGDGSPVEPVQEVRAPTRTSWFACSGRDTLYERDKLGKTRPGG